jgi:hypothetical protein
MTRTRYAARRIRSGPPSRTRNVRGRGRGRRVRVRSSAPKRLSAPRARACRSKPSTSMSEANTGGSDPVEPAISADTSSARHRRRPEADPVGCVPAHALASCASHQAIHSARPSTVRWSSWVPSRWLLELHHDESRSTRSASSRSLRKTNSLVFRAAWLTIKGHRCCSCVLKREFGNHQRYSDCRRASSRCRRTGSSS